MAFCSKCGGKLESYDEFCQKCGAKTKTGTYSLKKKTSTEKINKFSRWHWIILGAVVIVGLILFFVYIQLSTKSEEVSRRLYETQQKLSNQECANKCITAYEKEWGKCEEWEGWCSNKFRIGCVDGDGKDFNCDSSTTDSNGDCTCRCHCVGVRTFQISSYGLIKQN